MPAHRNKLLRRLIVLLSLAGTIALAFAPVALSHAVLLSSDPADGSVISVPPPAAVLTFSEPIDVAVTRVDVDSTAGASIEVGQPIRARSDEEVRVPLPAMVDGTFVLSWATTTKDGHLAEGQVIFQIGKGSDTPLSALADDSTSFGGLARTVIGGVSKAGFYAGIAAIVGSLLTLMWVRPSGGTQTADARTAFRTRMKKIIKWGWWAVVGATSARLALTVSQIVTSTPDTVSLPEALGRSVLRPSGLWILAFVLAAVLGFPVMRLSTSPVGERGRGTPVGLATSIVLALLAIGAYFGHTSSLSSVPLGVAIGTVHLIAVSVWIGPLAAVAFALAGSQWRAVPWPERRQVLVGILKPFGVAAGVSVGLIAITGLVMAVINVGSISSLFDSRYGNTLLAKIVLLGVALPLGLLNHLRGRQVRRDQIGPVGERKFRVSRVVEATVLATVLLLAVTLTAQPPPQAAPERFLADLSPEECAQETTFQLGCWRRYFESVVRKEDAKTALTKLEEFSKENSFVAVQCHQLSHDIGRYQISSDSNLPKALSQGIHICFSGYYHGILEQFTSAFTDAELLDRLDKICNEDVGRRYSFDHYNCVHGLGHGVTIREDHDVFTALPYCDAFEDSWERESCYSGVFMQNIIEDQLGGQKVTLDPEDPIFPCDAIDGKYKQQCYLMQTSNVIKQVNYDHAAAFKICDQVEADYVVTCYQSLGRDISGAALLAPGPIRTNCTKGTTDSLIAECFAGAAKNAVFTDANDVQAKALCASVADKFRARCVEAMEEGVRGL